MNIGAYVMHINRIYIDAGPAPGLFSKEDRRFAGDRIIFRIVFGIHIRNSAFILL